MRCSLSERWSFFGDTATKEEPWEAGDKMYYPKGVTAPDYCVLKFTARSGRSYSNFKSENSFTQPTK